jgi:hypothetical protein
MQLKITFSLLFVLISFSFVKAQSYFLNGSAEFVGGDCYQLTPDLGTQNGTVWYGEQLDISEPFDLQFRMNFGSTDANGADGMCFVLHTQGTSAIGVSGGGMGYLNFGTSLGIEFDTWQNSDYADPFFDHIAIQRNGDINHDGFNNIAGPVQASSSSQNIEDGEFHTVQITWNPETQLIEVYFDCELRLQGNQDLINGIFGGQNLVWWGFTAATGGSSNVQTVCLQENILSVGESVLICNGGSTQLSAGASLDGTYSWTPTESLDDPNSATPLASPTENTTYTCVYTDLCGVQQTATIDVIVGELELTMPSNIGDIDCNTPTVTITPSINFNNLNSYTWVGPNGATAGTTLVINANSVGTYTLTASSSGGCVDSESITVQGDFSVLPANAGSDQVINCLQSEVTLEAANVQANGSYEWFFGNSLISNSSTVVALAEGTYFLVVTNQNNGCESQDQVLVLSNFDEPIVSIPPQDTLDCRTRSLAISGIEITNVNSYEISWSTMIGQISNGANTLSPIVSQPGLYTATVTSLVNGCQGIGTIDVMANQYFYVNLDDLSFPNIITPNGDPANNNWRPFLLSNRALPILPLFDVYNLRIYNRWGGLVEEITRPNVWSPKEQEDGVYYYLLDYSITCGQTKTESIKGDIELVR